MFFCEFCKTFKDTYLVKHLRTAMVVDLLKDEEKNFFEKIFVFFTKYTLFAEKRFFYGKKFNIKKLFY